MSQTPNAAYNAAYIRYYKARQFTANSTISEKSHMWYEQRKLSFKYLSLNMPAYQDMFSKFAAPARFTCWPLSCPFTGCFIFSLINILLVICGPLTSSAAPQLHALWDPKHGTGCNCSPKFQIVHIQFGGIKGIYICRYELHTAKLNGISTLIMHIHIYVLHSR